MLPKSLLQFIILLSILNGYCFAIKTDEIKETLLKELKSKTNSSDIQETLVKFIKKAEDKDGTIKPLKIIHEFIDDPFKVEDFNITKENGFTEIVANFTDLEMYGLRDLKVNKLRLDLGEMKINIEMSIPLVRMIGQYSMDGKVTFFPINGNGQFWFNITELKMFGLISLKRNEKNQLQVSDIKLDADSEDLSLHFDNLLGGGSLSTFSNTILNELSGLMFERITASITSELSKDLTLYVDKQLQNVKLDVVNQSESLFDDYILMARKVIIDQGFDPFVLPNRTEKIGNNFLYYLLNGEISIYDGEVRGLSSLKRTGDVIVTYENDSIAFEGSFGFDDLLSKYSWSGQFMDLNNSGGSTITIKQIVGYIKIRQPLRKNTNPVVEELKILKLNNMWVDVTGLGKWDFVLEIIVNLISNTFKKTLMDLISGPTKNAINENFQNLTVTW